MLNYMIIILYSAIPKLLSEICPTKQRQLHNHSSMTSQIGSILYILSVMPLLQYTAQSHPTSIPLSIIQIIACHSNDCNTFATN